MADRRRLARLAVVGTAVAVSLVALKVFGGDDPPDPCQAPDAAPAAQLALMPAGLSFDRIGTITRVRKDRRYVVVRAVANKPIGELTILIQDAVTAAGYRPAGMDNEGFEAEVFFTTGSYAGGQALVRGTTCKGRWSVDLVLLDRDGVPSAATPGSPTTTTP